MRERNSRRAFLKVAAAAGGVQLSGIGFAQEDAREIELGGQTSGWQGVSPEDIEGEENPTLELEQGVEYVVEWSNEDGQPHNFTIEDDDGENLLETEIISSGSQEVEFIAEEEMAEYYCQPHPASMRGDIEVVESSPEQEEREEGEEPPDEEEEEEEEDEPEPDEDPSVGEDVDPDEDEPTETFELEYTEDGWVGVSPEDIEGEENPTLELEGGEVYEITATNTVERDEHVPGPVLVVLDDGESEVVHTDFLDEGAETGSVLFRANGDLDGYFDQMELDVGGDLDVTDGNGADDDDEETDDNGADDGTDDDGTDDGDD